MPLFLYLMTTSLIVIMANDGTQLLSLLDGSFWENGKWTARSPGSKLKEGSNTSPVVPEYSILVIPHKTEGDEQEKRRVQVLWDPVLNQKFESSGNDKQKVIKLTRSENALINRNNVNYLSTNLNFDKEPRITKSSACPDSSRTCGKNITAIESFNCTLPNVDISCYESDFPQSRPHKYQRRSASYPLKVDIYLTRRPLFGRAYLVFVTMPNLGNEKFVLNLTVDTKDYFIDEVVTDPGTKQNEWRYTKHFERVLRKRLLIHHRLPYTSCYFYRTRASFYKTDHKFVIARVSSYSDRSKLLAAEVQSRITVHKPPEASCMPIYSLRFCEDPDYPLEYWSKSHQLFMAVVTGDCGHIRYGHTRWDFYDLREKSKGSHITVTIFRKDLLKHVAVTEHFVLSLPPYGAYKMGVLLVLRAEAKINDVSTVARCYLRYTPPKVDVRIVGNERRKVDVRNTIILDGSQTRDLAGPIENFNTKKLVWSCRSKNDPRNRYCRSQISDTPVLRLPENALRRGFQYLFTLTVSPRENPGYTNTARQLLLGVSTDTFTPDIQCVRNCAYGVYAPTDSVHLKAKCKDCNEPIVRYEWWVTTSSEATEETLVSQTNFAIMHYRYRSFSVRLRVKLASKITAQAFYTLHRNDGPKNGSCTISPTSGIEVVTMFEINCRGFQAQFGPIYYRYVNPATGIIGQSQFARYVACLTATEEVAVYICDAIDMCVRQDLNVDVQSFKFKDPRAKPEQRIRQVLRNVPDLIRRGFWNSAVSRSIAATTHVKNADQANLIYASLMQQEAFSTAQLERVAVLATQLLNHLIPIGHKEALLLAKVLKQMCRIFQVVVRQGDRLQPQAYDSLTAMHMFYMSSLGVPSETHSKAMCTPNDPECLNIEKIHIAKRFSIGFDPLILVRINHWMLASWHLYKCVYFLGMMASQQANTYDKPLSVLKGGIAYQMNATHVKNPIKPLYLKTIDNIHELQMSAKLLDELRSKLDHKDILWQIISQQNHQNFFWWHPQPMPAATSVLIIHAYNRSGFTWVGDKSRLESPVVYKTDITKFSENKNFIKLISSGSIVDILEIHHYRVMLNFKAMLAVRVVNCSEPIYVNMRLHRRPTSKELIHSRCLVTPAMGGKRVWMANGCERSVAFVSIYRPGVYQALLTEGKAVSTVNYSILLEIHQCNHFKNRSLNPGWSGDHCNFSFEHSYGTSVHCTCHTLGILATRIFPILAQDQMMLTARIVLAIQWVIILLFLLLLLVLGVILVSSFGKIAANQHLVKDVECDRRTIKYDPNRPVTEELLLVIETGGQEFAGTTSNIKIYLKSPQQPENKYQITQDPLHPRLLRNTTNKMVVPKGTVNIPTRLALGIERNGRYPSWYCRTVTVIDLELKRHQLFVVERWIERGHTPLMRSKYFTIDSHQTILQQTWCKRFRIRFEQLYISWFWANPVMGPWQNSIGGWTMNRVERTAIMVSKVAVTTTVISLYYGKSSESVEKERLKYGSVRFNWDMFIGLSFYSFMCVCLVHMFFELFVMRLILMRD